MTCQFSLHPIVCPTCQAVEQIEFCDLHRTGGKVQCNLCHAFMVVTWQPEGWTASLSAIEPGDPK